MIVWEGASIWNFMTCNDVTIGSSIFPAPWTRHRQEELAETKAFGEESDEREQMSSDPKKDWLVRVHRGS